MILLMDVLQTQYMFSKLLKTSRCLHFDFSKIKRFQELLSLMKYLLSNKDEPALSCFFFSMSTVPMKNLHNRMYIVSVLLPTMYVVRGKVMFSLVCVILFAGAKSTTTTPLSQVTLPEGPGRKNQS